MSRVIFLAAALLAVGCEETNKYCERNPTDQENCAPPDESSGCTADEQCPGAVCETTSGTCVECTAVRSDGCPGTAPVCGSDNTCRGCTSHAECPSSDACLPDGSCGDMSQVAYVSPDGTMNADCTHVLPCTDVSLALATSRPFVKFSGTTMEQVALNSRNVTFLADPGAKLTDTTTGILLRIDGTSEVSIYDLEISGALGAGNAGISMQPGNAAKLTLTRATVTGNQGIGISASGGTLTVSQSTVMTNRGGGILASGGTFDISNSIIANNGDADAATGSTFGGLSLTGSPGMHRFAYNTIVYNHASAGTLSAAGIACSIAGFSATGNIITSNNEGFTFPAAQTKGTCTFGNSYVAPGSAANTLGFASITSSLDYHLTSASPASVVDAAGACTGVDIDGETRPSGGACDLGADELAP